MEINLPKMSLRLLLLLLLPMNALLAQTWKTPLQAGGNYVTTTINNFYFTSATQGWAVGNGGTILVTSNGGTNWAVQTSGTFQNLAGVYFTSATQGWVVGNNGTILVTNNGGTTWTAQTSGSINSLTNVYFTSGTQGWAVGTSGTILVTSNGGTTWTAQTSNTTQHLFNVNFVSATQGWAFGAGGTILVTSNGGTSWTTQTSGTTQILYGVNFVSATQGWAVGLGGTILVTSNGGTTWTAQTTGTTNGIRSVYFTSPTQGWAVGASGTILVTSNGGTTWTAQTSGTTNTLNGVYFTSATQGWAAGFNGTILVTSNGGTTWTVQTSGGPAQNLFSVNFTSATQGWAVGLGGTILVTSNGGKTWMPQTSGTTTLLFGVYFTSATQGWAVGSNGVIRVTSNGGTTWSAQTSGTTEDLFSVYFTSATQGWAVGSNGVIRVTSNGGTTWSAQTSGTTDLLNNVYFTSATQGWAVGANGVIRVTSNGGTTWSAQTSGTTVELFGIYFTSATQGWAVGSSGTIIATSNGGTTWTAQTSGTTSQLLALNFIDASKGWAVGNGGTILVTSNGGTTWSAQTSNTTNSLWSVNFKSATQGWAVGGAGTIMIYDGVSLPTTAPNVSTAGATLIGSTNATLGGNVIDSGSAAVNERGIVYATTINPTTANTKVQIGTGIGTFSQNVTGLSASTLYHVRAYAINSVGTSYGADSTFTTLPAPSTSPTITSFTPVSANVGNTITIKGTNFVNVTKVWFGECPTTNYTVVNDSTITAVVPNSAYTDNLALATTNGFVISQNNFRVINPQNVIFSSGGPMNYALRGGKLFAWGAATYGWGDSSNNARWCPFEVPLKGSLKGKTISQLSVGNAFAIVLATDNTVHTWGYNGFTQLGNDSNGLSSFVPVEITNNGDLAGKTVVQVMAASVSGYALTADGKLLAWGRDAAGEQGNGAIIGNVKSPKIISDSGSLAGKFIDKIGTSTEFGIFALASDKSIHAFGGGLNRKLGNGLLTNQIRSVVINQTGVLAGKTIVKIFSSSTGTLFLDNSGTAYGAGNDSTITLNSSNPIAINVGSGSSLQNKKILSVKCSLGSGYAMDTAQNIHTWGSNSSGQLGRNSTTGSLVPMDIEKTISSLNGKVAIGFNPSISNLFMLTNDGGIHATGAGSFGRLGDGQNTTNSLMAKNITFYGKPTTDASAVTVTNIGSNSATINWTNGNGQKRLVLVKPLSPIDGYLINDGVNYADTADFTKGNTLDGFSKVVYSGTANSVTVTGLDQSSPYHVAIFEFDSAVPPCNLSYYKLGTPAKGSFITTGPLSLAAVNTSSASLVTSTSATLGGNVTADGGASVTERGIVYATTINPTTANTKVQLGSGVGTFSQNVTGLTAATIYHVRAYAINSVGTSYGADSMFTTAAVSTPLISLTGNLTAFSTCQGISSAEQNFSVGGTNLTDDITINAPTGFEISTTGGNGFSTNISLPQSGGTVLPRTLFVRLASTATGIPSGDITATATGATTQTLAVNGILNTVPTKPVISSKPVSPVCVGAQSLNFGASQAAPAGINYQWTAMGATVYAQGQGKQFSLVSFPNSGEAKVMLTAASTAGCTNRDTAKITVNPDTVHAATVRYFNKNFICEANLVNKYQWGYDLQPSLEGAIINGEINQNYFNATPELSTKNYWVISTSGNCYQKTYYNKPSSLVEAKAANGGVSIYPNPVNDRLTIHLKESKGMMQIQVLDLHGKLCREVFSDQNETEITMDALAEGIYLVRCIVENEVIANSKVVKK